jgi:predicted lipoprotein with Yx(FWY)xxD motif
MLAGAVAATAVLAGCGSSSSSTTSTPATTSSAAAAKPAASTQPASNGVLIVSKHTKEGTALAAGPKHLTVYLFEKDTGGASTCSGACAGVWPPVTTQGTPQTSGAVDAAKLGTIKRADGTTQVTYDGHPLYFFAKDQDDGDTYGEGVDGFGAEWYMLAPSGNKIDNDDDGDSDSGSS